MKSLTTTKALQNRSEKNYSYYALAITECWDRVVSGIVAVGFLLCESRMNLTPYEWKRLVMRDCPFDLTVACRLMRIAQDQRVTDPEIAKALPPSWHKLYELLTLPEEVFRKGLESGAIHPEITVQEINRLRLKEHGETRPAEQEDRMLELHKKLIGVLDSFLFVDFVTAGISHPKVQVVEIKRQMSEQA